jgi:hypothetical protein
VIVRILDEGQYTLDNTDVDALNVLDAQVQSAVESEDDAGFRTALEALLAAVRRTGTPVSAGTLTPSDLVLPPADATLHEVGALLGEEGLIPG